MTLLIEDLVIWIAWQCHHMGTISCDFRHVIHSTNVRYLSPARLQRESGIVMRIVVGRLGLPQAQLDALHSEEEEHGPFLWVPVQVPLCSGTSLLNTWIAIVP